MIHAWDFAIVTSQCSLLGAEIRVALAWLPEAHFVAGLCETSHTQNVVARERALGRSERTKKGGWNARRWENDVQGLNLGPRV